MSPRLSSRLRCIFRSVAGLHRQWTGMEEVPASRKCHRGAGFSATSVYVADAFLSMSKCLIKFLQIRHSFGLLFFLSYLLILSYSCK